MVNEEATRTSELIFLLRNNANSEFFTREICPRKF
jgi:hypothetical protein